MNVNLTLSPQLRDWMDSIDANTTPKVLAQNMTGIDPVLRGWMTAIENGDTEMPYNQMRAVQYEGVPFEMRTWMNTNQTAVDVTNVMVPATASVQLDGTVQFDVTGEHGDLTWSVVGGATKGSVSVAGLYTAPANLPTPATATVSAVDEETPTAETVTAAITLVAKLAISPTTADVAQGATRQFTRTGGKTPFTWSVAGDGLGTIDQTGLYTAPDEDADDIVRVTDSQTTPVAADAEVTVATVATPEFDPAAGSYTGTQSVEITSDTAGATIYYTTNGDTPDDEDTEYTVAIDVEASETIKAIAVKTNMTDSAVGSAAYVIAVETPTFDPVAGSYGPTQSVEIDCETSGATIYYTTNGSTPTTGSTLYEGAISVTSTKTIKALAVKEGMANSAVGSALYTINGACGTPTFDPTAGSYGPTQNVAIASTTAGASIYYTDDGSTPDSGDTLYATPVEVAASKTLKAIAIKTGWSDSEVGSAAYTINGACATPTFDPVAGSYEGTQNVAISSTTPSTTIYYTVNGDAPTTGSTLYESAVAVTESLTLKAIAVKTGWSNSAVGSAAYVIS